MERQKALSLPRGFRPRCPYCRELFVPSRYHSDQVVCSGKECQRRRRTEYRRQKRRNDPAYREQCCDSQEKWRDRHPDYMQKYRRNARCSTGKPSLQPGIRKIGVNRNGKPIWIGCRLSGHECRWTADGRYPELSLAKVSRCQARNVVDQGAPAKQMDIRRTVVSGQ